MPISLASYIIPKNGGQFFLMDDKYLRGGFRTCADIADRDAIFTAALKDGMLAPTISDNKYWKYVEQTTSWVEIPLGVAGPQGPVGPQGPAGAQGPTGPQGPAGTFSGTYAGNGSVTGTWSYKNTYASAASFPSASNLQGTVVIAADTGKAYVSTGSAWKEIQFVGSSVYDIALSAYDALDVADDLLSSFTAPRQITIASGASGVATCGTGPAASTTLKLFVGATQIGTVVFAVGATTGTVSITNNTTLTQGQVLKMVNSSTPDANLQDVSVTLMGSA